MATPEQINKEIDLIQEVIKRMASNSFEVKKWLVGLLTIILVFKHDELLGGNIQLIWLLLGYSGHIDPYSGILTPLKVLFQRTGVV